ncbi:DUF5683 domain-containing protein [Marinoscillum sp. MHG1-6]|uniref:DUF5683 domain-containing protein n=1 Tax=Marinoscillum sp. MHG1-6 TaxID=2959627 RepID=UPI00215804D4|nr:DUF5683 domain-containing protein [Marinoscillum sp. MHG1-6]
MIRYLFVITVLFWIFESNAQISKADSIFLMTDANLESFQSVSKLNPQKAAFLSAIVPGLGQAYNNQYWKIPIIYGGGIIFAHYISYNHRIYQEMQNALIAETDQSESTVNFYAGIFNQTALENNRNVFRRNRDFLIILTSAFYLLNIVEAHVSAHLDEFEVNENLSMTIVPVVESTPLISRAVGFSVSLNF